MFHDVEKADTRDAMKIGIGTDEQAGALRVAGAEKVFDLSDLAFFIKHPGHLLRDGDTLLMVQPNLIKKSDMRVILSATGEVGILCEVAGHKPMICDSEAQLSAYRQLKPQDVAIPMANKLGRPSGVEYTLQQADAIIREWHRVPKNMPPSVTSIAENILGVDAGTLGKTWVRDLVIKFVGTAQRAKPDHWQGISTETNKEGS
tara:strand:+ start:445 stop:1053 length:609 start_codon:yes stop_codon:yes gene_type:complete